MPVNLACLIVPLQSDGSLLLHDAVLDLHMLRHPLGGVTKNTVLPLLQMPVKPACLIVPLQSDGSLLLHAAVLDLRILRHPLGSMLCFC